MKRNQTYWEALIGKYLSGNFSPSEEIELQAWIQENAHNKQKFESYKKIWEASYKDLSLAKSDVDQGWDVIHSAIQDSFRKTPKQRKANFILRWNRTYILRTAAILLLVVLAGITLFQKIKTQEAQQVFVSTESNGTEQHMLPDGSIVWLNAYTQIQYEQDFQERKVQLIQGEAFFDVRKDPEHPFEVYTSSSKTTVLGTRFNLRILDKTNNIELFVDEGKVSFEHIEEVQTANILQVGERAVLHQSTKTIEKQETDDQNILSWKTQRLQFDHMDMRYVIPHLEKYFQVQFEVSDPGILNCDFKSAFDKPTLTEVLETLKIGLNADVITETDHYLIQATPCQ